MYNHQIELVERLEAEGRLTVLRPQKPITVSRIERDSRRLRDLYDEGYAIANSLIIE